MKARLFPTRRLISIDPHATLAVAGGIGILLGAIALPDPTTVSALLTGIGIGVGGGYGAGMAVYMRFKAKGEAEALKIRVQGEAEAQKIKDEANKGSLSADVDRWKGVAEDNTREIGKLRSKAEALEKQLLDFALSVLTKAGEIEGPHQP
jgi:hypothetical protein